LPEQERPAGALGERPVYTLAIVAGASCIAEAAVVVKTYPKSDSFVANALPTTVGTLILAVTSLVAREAWAFPTQSATWASVIYLVLIGSVAVFYLFLFVIRRWTVPATS
jgi:drug/metabolite transporter (DMT)-like permease